LADRFNWSYFGAALVAGILAGFAATTVAYRTGLFTVPGQTLVQRMTRELNLTPAQRNQIARVIEDAQDQVAVQRTEFERERRKILWQAYVQIRSTLTPVQQQKFDRIFAGPSVHDEPPAH
jgi:Spy/CpxP family protein refolding chaperone